MSFQDSMSQPPSRFDLPGLDRLARLIRTLRATLRTPFDERQKALTAEVERLRALDDEELARLGLRRNDILWHVFACKKL